MEYQQIRFISDNLHTNDEWLKYWNKISHFNRLYQTLNASKDFKVILNFGRLGFLIPPL
jgi:hypothetical protein